MNMQVTLPDPELEILDMMPRLDIIEDQNYRRTLPKSVKAISLNKNFSEMLDYLPSSTKFCSKLTKGALNATIEREKRQYKKELQQANKIVSENMERAISQTKNFSLLS